MLTDIEFVRRLAIEQQRRQKWGRKIGVSLLIVGVLLMIWAIVQSIENYKTQLALLQSLAIDRNPSAQHRLETMAGIGYRSGIFVGVGLSSGYFVGCLMAYHGIVLLVSRFRRERLLIAAYDQSDTA